MIFKSLSGPTGGADKRLSLLLLLLLLLLLQRAD
jgi:hypothetical protein